MEIRAIFLSLLLVFCNVRCVIVQDPSNSGVENPIEKAIKVLQVENIEKLQMKIEDLKRENEKKDTMIELLEAKEKINLAIIDKMKADHKDEIDNIKKEHSEEMKAIKEDFSKDGSKYENKMAAYFISVLKQSNDLIKYWQEMMQSLTEEITKLQKYQKVEKVLQENKETVDWLEGLLKTYNITDSVNTEKLLKKYEELVIKQSGGMNMLIEILTSKNSSSHGLVYVEEDGVLVEVTICECASEEEKNKLQDG